MKDFAAAEIERPKLTFDPDVAELVRRHYAAADVILEYGSGGSTVMASEMPGKTIHSVESSRVWTKMMRRWFDQAQPPSMPVMHHANIGKTGKWGTPVDRSGVLRYHLYPCAIWDDPDFTAPDVVLVDGRFRVACALTTMLRTEKPLTLLFDDYEGRRGYAVLEEFLTKAESVGRMARFEIDPTDFPRDKLTKLVGMFVRHF